MLFISPTGANIESNEESNVAVVSIPSSPKKKAEEVLPSPALFKSLKAGCMPNAVKSMPAPALKSKLPVLPPWEAIASYGFRWFEMAKGAPLVQMGVTTRMFERKMSENESSA